MFIKYIQQPYEYHHFRDEKGTEKPSNLPKITHLASWTQRRMWDWSLSCQQWKPDMGGQLPQKPGLFFQHRHLNLHTLSTKTSINAQSGSK